VNRSIGERGIGAMSIVGGGKARVEKAKARGKAREALDHEWMRKHRQGKSAAEIAEAEGVSKRTVQLALARVKAAEQAAEAKADRDEESTPDGPSPAQRPWWLELVPLFPIGAFTPTSACPHHGPIREGSLFCCMVCSTSGMDHHPALQRDPLTDPRPEPRPSPRKPAARPAAGAKPSPHPEPAAGRETRKERRRRQFAAAEHGAGA
jgi:hypothetical protein